MRLGLTLACAMAASLMLPTFRSDAARTKPNTELAPRPDENALCSFITNNMQSALPQVPTLCAPVTDSPYSVLHTLSVSIFSPTGVLKRRMRRAWSTALFQTLKALFYGNALQGACGPATTVSCELRVSDSSMPNLYYEVLSPTNPGGSGVLIGSTYVLRKVLSGDLASDDAYINWWHFLVAGKTARHPKSMSKSNAEWIARTGCKEFTEKFREFDSVLPKSPYAIPGCSVMLATDKSAYVVLDFPTGFDARVTDYTFELPDTLGKDFDGTAYEGKVIFRSPWNGSGNRTYEMYSLDNLELAWEESQASGDDKSGTGVIGRLVLSGQPGVESQKSYANASSSAAVVRITPVPGANRVLVDLTNGSQWSVKQEDVARCSLKPGTKVPISFTAATDHDTRQYILLVQSGSGMTPFRADFVQGW